MVAQQIVREICLRRKLISETVLILGGEVRDVLHPSVASIQSFGPCGSFQSDIPPLPEPRREFAAALLGQDVVLCGGYGLFSPQKVSLK